jgi:hypothetical protein
LPGGSVPLETTFYSWQITTSSPSEHLAEPALLFLAGVKILPGLLYGLADQANAGLVRDDKPVLPQLGQGRANLALGQRRAVPL